MYTSQACCSMRCYRWRLYSLSVGPQGTLGDFTTKHTIYVAAQASRELFVDLPRGLRPNLQLIGALNLFWRLVTHRSLRSRQSTQGWVDCNNQSQTESNLSRTDFVDNLTGQNCRLRC